MTNPLFDALFAGLEGRKSPVLFLPDGQDISGDAFFKLVAKSAHALVAAGVQPGDRVALQIAKSPQALALYGASVAIGAVFLPLNPSYTAAEIRYFINDATPRVILCDPKMASAIVAFSPDHRAQLFTLDAAGRGSFAEYMVGQPEILRALPRKAQDLAAILYTSGTTGRSKGAMLTHANLLSNAETLAAYWHFTSEDVLLHALPIFHTHGLFVASNVSLLTGGSMIFLPSFDAKTVLREMARATVMMGVPTFYTRLLDQAEFDAKSAGHVRLFVSGSAPLLADTHAAFFARSGHRILERYGMTETNMNTSNPYTGERRAGTVGFPLPDVALKITENGTEVVQGAVGMVEVRGPNVFAGYWQMPEKTAEDLRADGWFLTGDLGRIDVDGYVQIVGRLKDMVISGGFNIYPKEVELLLDAIPGVAESAVIGLPHPDFGEAVFAVLAATPGQVLDVDLVLETLHPQLARFKHPKAAVVVADLPRNAMGKVQKNVLREEYGGWFGGGR